LLIHIIGTIYSKKNFNKIKEIIKSYFEHSSSKEFQNKKIPKEYLYNYHLKPTNDLRLQQVEN
jgi:TfoX/Sxy family transcriptional regulator of competence genes